MSDTLSENLKVYEIGKKLKRLRLRKSMGLADLSKHTGLSPAMLSKLENGHLIPTLTTLQRIALVFAVGLDFFFTDHSQNRFAVIRKEERQEFHEFIDGKKAAYRFQSLDFKAVDRKSSAFIAYFESMPPEDVPMHEHAGSEFLYVLSGTLGLTFEGKETAIEAGDSVYFDPSFQHGYRRIGSELCTAVVIATP